MGYRLVKVYSNSSALVLFHVLMSTPVVKFSIINTGNFANITIGIIDAQHGHHTCPNTNGFRFEIGRSNRAIIVMENRP
jgi:hypothetical protein